MRGTSSVSKLGCMGPTEHATEHRSPTRSTGTSLRSAPGIVQLSWRRGRQDMNFARTVDGQPKVGLRLKELRQGLIDHRPELAGMYVIAPHSAEKASRTNRDSHSADLGLRPKAKRSRAPAKRK